MSPRRPLIAAATALGALVLAAGPASAHVDASPRAIQAGTTGTVSFGVEHGCETSPTVKLELRFPDGFTAIEPMAKEGWTTAVTGTVVSFTGGSLPADEPGEFAVEVKAPAAAATTYVPVVQTCEKGSLAWIEIPEEGKDEPELPAATLVVTAAAPTAADLANPDEGEEAAADENDGGGSSTGVVVGIVAAVVVVAGAAVLVVRKRRNPPAP